MDIDSYLIRIPSLMGFECDAYHTHEQISFYKYQACGNNFIMIDNTDLSFDHILGDVPVIKRMCDQRFGIGADGLIVLSKHTGVGFEMIYHNSDGKVAHLCGNGSRCALAFAQYRGLYDSDKEVTFLACDGIHKGGRTTRGQYDKDYYRVSMNAANIVTVYDENNYFIDIGSPHHVCIINDIAKIDVITRGQEIRNSSRYKHIGGVNVNYVEIQNNCTALIRTYERGVEDETSACGTGCVSAAIAIALSQSVIGESKMYSRRMCTNGGDVYVDFNMIQSTPDSKLLVDDIWLVGPAQPVFHGVYCNIKDTLSTHSPN